MVSGNAIIVPRAFKESALTKGKEKQKQTKYLKKSKCTKWECLSFLFSYAYLWMKGEKINMVSFKKELVGPKDIPAAGMNRRQL